MIFFSFLYYVNDKEKKRKEKATWYPQKIILLFLLQYYFSYLKLKKINKFELLLKNSSAHPNI